jgi:hypothetical protein
MTVIVPMVVPVIVVIVPAGRTRFIVSIIAAA